MASYCAVLGIPDPVKSSCRRQNPSSFTRLTEAADLGVAPDLPPPHGGICVWCIQHAPEGKKRERGRLMSATEGLAGTRYRVWESSFC